MSAARAFSVKCMDIAALEGGDRILDKAAFVERVGVDRDGDVELLGDGQAAIDRGWGCPPILVQFEAAGARLDHLDERLRLRCVALAEEAEIDRQALGGLHDPREMPWPRRAGRRRRAGSRPRAAAEHCRDAAVERLLAELRADQVDVAVDAAGGDDLPFAGDDFGARPYDDIDAGLDVGIAGLTDAAEAAVANADIGFDDSPMIKDHRVGNNRIDGPLGARALALPHTVADNLAATELDLLAIDRAVLFNLDDQLRIGQPDAVARRRAEHRSIGAAADRARHVRASR